MSGQQHDDLQRPQHLMMAALDGEIAEHDRTELERLLAGDAALRREWEQLRRVKEVTGTMTLSQPPDEIWDDYWRDGAYRRYERGFGWILISLGAITLAGFGLWRAVGAILSDAALPGFVKVAIFALLMGGAVLLVSVIREKLFIGRHDPYRKVKR